jgi:hypothetical protein
MLQILAKVIVLVVVSFENVNESQDSKKSG